MSKTTDQLAPAVDESRTAPGDRLFRPDVQGLRAAAILLVVLFHIGVPGFGGGYIGVDVFFVISGFVITGVLMREHAAYGTTSLRAFYGRRARRIIPAAALVIVVTVAASYVYLGSVTGRSTAVDGQWATVFLANFHFAGSSTNYLASMRPPSPLQNFWSLAVEEQFYVVYPVVFLILAKLAIRVSMRARLTIVLSIAALSSYALSITLTTTNPSGAFFYPFTRAWELALGGIIAASTSYIRRVPRTVAAVASWLGLAVILVAASALSATSAYPGWLVAFPVVGAGLIIAGGTAEPMWGVEYLLRRRPFQLLGIVSYSWYLWHWPILTIATEASGKARLPIGESTMLMVLALGVAIGTYFIVENPLRRSRSLASRRWASIALGSCLVAASLALTTIAASSTRPVPTTDVTTGAPGTSCRTQSEQEAVTLRKSVRASSFNGDHRAAGSLHLMTVIGDSTACTMVPGLSVVGSSYGLQVANGAVIGCGVVSGEAPPLAYDGVNVTSYSKACMATAGKAQSTALAQGRPDIILWESTRESGSVVIRTRSGSTDLIAGTPQWAVEIHRRIETRVRELMATGVKVLLVLDPAGAENPKPAQPSAADQAITEMNSILEDVARSNPRQVGVVDLASFVCPSGPPCPYVTHGEVLRSDDVHYLPQDSFIVATWMVPEILRVARAIPN